MLSGRRQVAKSPVNLAKVKEAWKEIGELADRPARLVLAGDPALIERAQTLIGGGERVVSMPGGGAQTWGQLLTSPGETLIVFGSSGEEAAIVAGLQGGSERGPTVVAIEEGHQATGAATHLAGGGLRLSFADTSQGWSRLLACCAQVAGRDLVALGRRYPILRPFAAQRVVNQTAAQNALIGLLVFLPGADMPAMTLNQVKMILQLAGIHDQPVDKERALEMAGVVALGFGFRGLGRRVAGLVPGIGWLFKAILGYTTTSALGTAAVRYFEGGAPAATSNMVALVQQLRR
jgi:uncharacterized protein (DUF697 family)